jgi:hypothetical protein
MPRSQERATCHYPETDESSPCPPILLVWWQVVNNCNLSRPRERTPVPIYQEVRWSPEPVRKFLDTEKPLAPEGIWTLGRPGRNLVTIITELYRLPEINANKTTYVVVTCIFVSYFPCVASLPTLERCKDSGPYAVSSTNHTCLPIQFRTNSGRTIRL